MDTAEDFIPVSKVPEYLPFSLGGVYGLIKQNKLHPIQIGRKLYIKRSDLTKVQNEGTAPYEGTPVIGKSGHNG